MGDEIRVSIRVRLPDEPADAATRAQAIFVAWRGITEALQGCEIELNDFHLSEAKRRRGRPRLVKPTTTLPAA